MKKKRFSVEQIVAILKQAELGIPIAELIRQVGISEQTFYRWKKKYSGLEDDHLGRHIGTLVKASADDRKAEITGQVVTPLLVKAMGIPITVLADEAAARRERPAETHCGGPHAG